MLILGHRGYDAKYPPNTVIAMVKAVEYGADGVELDVWRTKDGKIVLSHDRNIKKLAGLDDDFDIKAHTYEEIKGLRTGKELFPLLDEIYSALPKTAFVNVEIKDYDAVKGALEIIKRHSAMGRSVVSSFDVKHLELAKRLEPEIRTAFIVGKKKNVLSVMNSAYKVRAEYINIPFQAKKGMEIHFLRAILRFYRFFGFKIGLWTPNSEKDMEGYEGLVDMVITDEVEEMLHLKERQNVKK